MAMIALTAQNPDKLLQFQPGADLTVVVPTDGDGDVSNVAWKWYRSSSSTSGWTAIDDATMPTYTVSDTSTDNDVGMYLRVEATYSDPRGPGKTASFVSIESGAGRPGQKHGSRVHPDRGYQGDNGEH